MKNLANAQLVDQLKKLISKLDELIESRQETVFCTEKSADIARARLEEARGMRARVVDDLAEINAMPPNYTTVAELLTLK